MNSFYVSGGLLSPEHTRRIGSALWEFLWLISHETREEGRVLNGAPITLKRIATDLGEAERTARTNLRRLESEGYISRHRAIGTAYEYRIANSKKWVKGPEENFRGVRKETAGVSGRKLPQGPEENCRANKEVEKVERVERAENTVAPQNGAHPTLQEVTLYCKERGNTVDPQHWFDYYTANGWRVGRNSMKDWKAAVRTWEKNGVKNHANGKLTLAEILARETAILRSRAKA
jgi:DNA-binding Lrp family transcriptional regulator